MLALLSDLEDLISTDHRKRLFNESQRNFTAVLKSETKRSVHPYLNFSFMPRDKKMVQFLSELKKKRLSMDCCRKSGPPFELGLAP